MKRSRWAREFAFAGMVVGAVVVGYHLTAAKAGARIAVETPMRREQMAIEAEAEKRLPPACGRMDFKRSREIPAVQAAAVLPHTPPKVLLLDGPSGHLFSFDPESGSVVLERGLSGLSGAATAIARSGRIFVAQGTSIHAFNVQGAPLHTTNTDLAIWSFDVLQSGGFAVSAYVKHADGTAWVYVLGPSGALRQRLGLHKPFSSADPASTFAYVATDGSSTVFSAGAFAPDFWIFSLTGGRAIPVDLPIPGLAAVAALARRPDLVNVGHGELALPALAVGAAWVAPDYYVLVDAPRPLLFRVARNGRVAGCEAGPDLDPGVELRGLYPAGAGRLYTIGFGLDGSSRVYSVLPERTGP